MKVGILSPAYGLGGASKVATYIGNALNDKKTGVFFISYLDSALPESTCKSYNIFQKKSIFFKYFQKIAKYISFTTKGYFSPERYVRDEIKHLRLILKKEEPDILILNTFIPGVLFSSFIKKEFPNIKLITWMHSDPEYSLNHIAKYYKKAYKESFKKVDRVICLSEEVKDTLNQYGANTQVIYNPLILSSNEISKLTNNTISFTARLDIYIKGIDYLCELANYLPDNWSIRIAGDGSREEKEKFMELIKKNKVEKKIKFIGPLFGQDLINHYKESSLFISTSRTEGLPLVMIEAISLGLPVISFNHKGAKEILVNGKFGILVPNGEVHKMAMEVNRVIKERTILEEYQLLSLERAKDFKPEKIIQEWKFLLSDLILEGK